MSMKKLLYIIPLVMFAMTSCDWFELDNMDGHNAQVEGKFIDSKTGEPVYAGMAAQVVSNWWGSTNNPTGGIFQIYEKGWDAEVAQTWYCKNDGTYRNDLVWAGSYYMKTTDSNFLPTEQEFTLKEGKNTVDFTVTPYARVIGEPTFTYDSANKQIKASVKVEAGDASVTNLTVELQCFTDRFVCSSFNNVKNDPGTKVADAAQNETIELVIDMTNEANVTQFQYERTHYLRIGVLGQGGFTGWSWAVNPNARYNYSATYALSTDGTITKVTEW